jgi:hypothetical protein
VFALNGALGDAQDAQQEHAVHSQEVRHLGQFPGWKAFADRADYLRGGFRMDGSGLRHMSIIMRQMSG